MHMKCQRSFCKKSSDKLGDIKYPDKCEEPNYQKSLEKNDLLTFLEFFSYFLGSIRRNIGPSIFLYNLYNGRHNIGPRILKKILYNLIKITYYLLILNTLIINISNSLSMKSN